MILDTETAIVERLEEALEGQARIQTAQQLADVEERQQLTPAVHVIYSGYTPTREVGEGAVQEIETRWMIVVAVRSARRNGTTEKADPIFDGAIKALAGWKPGNGKRALKLAPAPAAEHRAGFSYYPLMFVSRETVRAGAGT